MDRGGGRQVSEGDASTAGPLPCSPFMLHCGVWGLGRERGDACPGVRDVPQAVDEVVALWTRG